MYLTQLKIFIHPSGSFVVYLLPEIGLLQVNNIK